MPRLELYSQSTLQFGMQFKIPIPVPGIQKSIPTHPCPGTLSGLEAIQRFFARSNLRPPAHHAPISFE